MIPLQNGHYLILLNQSGTVNKATTFQGISRFRELEIKDAVLI